MLPLLWEATWDDVAREDLSEEDTFKMDLKSERKHTNLRKSQEKSVRGLQKI